MADWIHKEVRWLGHWHSSGSNGKFLGYQLMNQKGIIGDVEGQFSGVLREDRAKMSEQEWAKWIEVRLAEIEEWKSKSITFTEWLDIECVGGWEVFKIYDTVINKFLRRNNKLVDRVMISCIFRKKN
jgi:hypothetical protein